MNRDGILASAIDAIGDTPLVALDRLTADHDGRIVAKLELTNPGFSKKDQLREAILRLSKDVNQRTIFTQLKCFNSEIGKDVITTDQIDKIGFLVYEAEHCGAADVANLHDIPNLHIEPKEFKNQKEYQRRYPTLHN